MPKSKNKSSKTTKTKVVKQPKAVKPFKAAKPNAPPKEKAESKKSLVIKLLQRTEGATTEEIMQATGWQSHTVRSAVCTLVKKYGLDITKDKPKDEKTIYKIAIKS